MFYDFQLNSNGDILFEESTRNDSALQFDFFVAPTNGLMFNFYIDNYESKEFLDDLEPQLVFDFCIDNPENNKEILCIDNKDDYIYQQLKIRLSSALGTIRGNEDIGSTLDLHRHKLLNSDKGDDYADLSNCVKNAISDILPHAEVRVMNKPSIYTDFTNSLVVYISQDDINFYYYL